MKKRNNPKDVRKIFVCGVDWQHEIGHASDVKMYASEDDLKRKRTCWESCGIVQLEVRIVKWTHPQDLFKIVKKK